MTAGGSPARKLRFASLALLALLSVASLFVGVATMTPAGLLVDTDATRLLLLSRLPRTLAAILSGAGLAIAGLIMQTIARNRFVEPSTAGTAQSAALGILLVMLLLPAASLPVKTAVASLAALAGSSVFLAAAHRLPPTEPYLIPLFGLVYGGIIGAAATFIGWQSDLLQVVEIWTSGEFSGVMLGRYEMLWIAAGMVGLAWWVADRLTLVSLGRETSIGLGLDYRRMVQIGLVIVSVISALVVVVVGMIPFVGLVVPNIISRIAGDNLRATIPTVAVSGAILVLASDIVGRLIRFPYEVPVGTVMGVAGSALFLWLVFRPARA